MIYPSVSWYSSREANYIQVSQMVKAFEAVGVEVTVLYKRARDSQEVESKGLVLIETGRKKLAHYWYLLKASSLTIIQARKGNQDLIYTRSVYIGALCAIFTKLPVFMEIHADLPGMTSQFCAKLAVSRRASIVCISHSLQKALSARLPHAKIIVAPDAHGIQMAPSCNPQALDDNWSKDYLPKIGYFGSIGKQKGESIIRELVDLIGGARFYIYSLNGTDVSGKHLQESKSLAHDEAIVAMSEMDCLLLTISPTKTKGDISPYTSPLKLYEYAAAGKIIFSSDLAILREVVSDDEVMYFDNTTDDFRTKLEAVMNDSQLRRKLRNNVIEFARNNTWQVRCKKLLDHFEEALDVVSA